MDPKKSPATQEMLGQLEKIQKASKPDEVHALVDELEQNHFFTDGNLETLEMQREVRNKIDHLLGNIKIISNDRLKGRIESLHQKLGEMIGAKEKRMETPPPPPSEEEMEEIEEEMIEESIPKTVQEATTETEGALQAETENLSAEIEQSVAIKTDQEVVRETEETVNPGMILLKRTLKNPDDLGETERDTKDPTMVALVQLMKAEALWPNGKKFDQDKFDGLSALLQSSEKIPSASQAKKIKEARESGVQTSDDMDKKIFELEEKADKIEGEIETLNGQIAQQTTIMQSMRGQVKPEDKKKLEELNEKLTKEKQGQRELKNRLKIYKEVQPFFGGNKLSPRQLLLKVMQFTQGEEKDLKNLGERADRLVSAQERQMAPESKWDKISRFVKPSLKATLGELSKTEELKDLKGEELETLAGLSGNPDGLAVWVGKLKENAKNVVPVVMAYLQMTIVDGKLNIISRGRAMELLGNLRKIRNKLITKKVNGNPDLLNAKPQVRMQAYLNEMNAWDEKSVQLNRNVIDDLVMKSYASKASKAIVGGVALGTLVPWIGLPAIGSAISYLGWGTLAKIGLVGAHAGGKKMIKAFAPEAESAYGHTITRMTGMWLMGPIGLAAPELIKGLKFMFEKRKEIREGAIKTGKVASATAGVSWAITKGAGKVLAWPFKKAFGKKAA